MRFKHPTVKGNVALIFIRRTCENEVYHILLPISYQINLSNKFVSIKINQNEHM